MFTQWSVLNTRSSWRWGASFVCLYVLATEAGRAGMEPKRLRRAHLPQQTPGVFTKVWTDGGQEQGLSLYELEDQVSVHPLDRQLSILVFGCLQSQAEMGQRSPWVSRTGQQPSEFSLLKEGQVPDTEERVLPGTQRSQFSEPLWTSFSRSAAPSSRCQRSSHCTTHTIQQSPNLNLSQRSSSISLKRCWNRTRGPASTKGGVSGQCSAHLGPPINPRQLPGEDAVVEGVGGSRPQVVLVGDHLLHPLHPRVKAQDAGVGHRLHEVGVLHGVAGVGQSQSHPWEKDGKTGVTTLPKHFLPKLSPLNHFSALRWSLENRCVWENSRMTVRRQAKNL